jgi:hypothetical protein
MAPTVIANNASAVTWAIFSCLIMRWRLASAIIRLSAAGIMVMFVMSSPPMID